MTLVETALTPMVVFYATVSMVTLEMDSLAKVNPLKTAKAIVLARIFSVLTRRRIELDS